MTNSKTVKIGSCVKLKFGKRVELYKIVNPYEADIAKNMISCDSPLGNALLGCREGETVELKTVPEESVEYKVEAVK